MPVRTHIFQIEVSKRLLFRMPALFGENTREYEFNVVGAAPTLAVWHTLVLHASGFLRASLHDACTSSRE